MSYPDMSDLSTAYTLCTCSDVCSRHCIVCQSPTWFELGCVKEQYLNAFKDDAPQQLKPVYEPGEAVPLGKILRNMPIATVSGPPVGIPASVRRPAGSPEELIEQCIDWLEENGSPLLPWQAQAFRAIMLGKWDHATGRF